MYFVQSCKKNYWVILFQWGWRKRLIEGNNYKRGALNEKIRYTHISKTK